MTNSTLKFGKFKGQDFYSTPEWYQKWLLNQDWFKAPVKLSPLQQISKEMSQTANKLKGWNGYSRNGQASYDRMFQLEMAESDAMYCDCGNMKDPNERSCGMGCFSYPNG